MDVSLEQLYVQHALGLRRLAYVLCGDRQLADDLVQDCFIAFGARMSTVDDPAGYLRRSVVNGYRSHLRRQVVLRRCLSLIGRQRESAVQEPGDGLAVHEELLAALRLLSARQREAVVLRHYCDLSEQQVSEVMGCRPGTVKALAAQGRARLLQVLTQAREGEPR